MNRTVKTVLTVMLLLGIGPRRISSEPASPEANANAIQTRSPAVKANASPSSPLAGYRQVAEGLFCGGQPRNDADFQWLVKQGIRTIVSVDGVPPNLDLARRHQIRYIHVPLRYDGVNQTQRLQLATIAETCFEPTYIHCHHGKHRGPTAAAIIGLTRKDLNHHMAIEVLNKAGTSVDYPGLWKAIRNWQPPSGRETRPTLTSSVSPEPIVKSMVSIDRLFERVSQRTVTDASVNWRVLASESQLLLDSLVEFRRSHVKKSEMFQALSTEAEQRARQVRSAVSKKKVDVLKGKISLLGESCIKCHEQFRN